MDYQAEYKARALELIETLRDVDKINNRQQGLLRRAILEEPEDLRRVILCKDCKFFEVDRFSNIFGAPIIAAHNVCGRLEIASKPDGFCFLASPKDSKDLTKDEGEA